MSTRVGAIFWFVRDILPALVSLGTGLVLWHRRQSARHWPMTYGRIEVAIACDEQNKWFSDLSYSYSVGGEYYSGTFRLNAKNEDEADRQVLAWRNQTLSIRYSPKDPTISVIRMEDQMSLPDAVLPAL